MTEKTGGCLCGAVRFTATDVPEKIGICHCKMCRRWTGGAFIAATVPTDKVRWTGEDAIRRIQSSHWAERAWCDHCGTHLWFAVTREGPYHGELDLPIGLFDDPDGFTLVSEIYIDHKPDGFAFEANDRTIMTRADCVEKFAVLNEDPTIQEGDAK